MSVEEYSFVIIGGGIAAVSCAQELCLQAPDESILIISASSLIKVASNVQKVGHVMQAFEIVEKSSEAVFEGVSNLKCMLALVSKVYFGEQTVETTSGYKARYKKLCLCTGGKPNLISNHPLVMGIRDTETVAAFQSRLKDASRIIVVGNGGIATELVYELTGIDIIWAIKHASISATFVDAGAAEFFLPHLHNAEMRQARSKVSKRWKYGHTGNTSSVVGQSAPVTATGSALGPDWATELSKTDIKKHIGKSPMVTVEFSCEVAAILSYEEVRDKADRIERSKNVPEKDCWPIYVELTNGKIYGADFVVSATGVEPNTELWIDDVTGAKLTLADDGGIPVNDQMETAKANVYAAGDACTAAWNWAQHWIQMRLWTQAMQMGVCAARAMSSHLGNGQSIPLDICFDIFTHITTFFGFKVVLLGKFNGQGLTSDDDSDVLLRVSKGEEYVKVILLNGKVYGAILIGETDLEETFENLILNQTDVDRLKDDLLNPSIDIEDYFD